MNICTSVGLAMGAQAKHIFTWGLARSHLSTWNAAGSGCHKSHFSHSGLCSGSPLLTVTEARLTLQSPSCLLCFMALLTLTRFLQPLKQRPQTRGLKTAGIHSLPVPEARSLESGCHRVMLSLKALGEDPSLPLPVSGGPSLSLACGCITSIPASVCTGPPPHVCVSPLLSSVRTPVIRFRAHPG